MKVWIQANQMAVQPEKTGTTKHLRYVYSIPFILLRLVEVQPASDPVTTP